MFAPYEPTMNNPNPIAMYVFKPVVIQSSEKNKAKRIIANPMSFSPPRIANANPHAAIIGKSALGGTIRRPINLCVGVERSSRFEAKYEAKKKAKSNLAISTG